jgi:hypothetical protein
VTLNFPLIPKAVSIFPTSPVSASTRKPRNGSRFVSFLNMSFPITSREYGRRSTATLEVVLLAIIADGSAAPAAAAVEGGAGAEDDDDGAGMASPSRATEPSRILSLYSLSRDRSVAMSSCRS